MKLHPTPPRRQTGMTLFGMLFWAILVSFAGLVTLKVLPTVNEYITIKRAVKKIVDERHGSIPALRAAFDRQKSIEYSISSIDGRDLEIEAVGDGFVVRFAYDKEIELFEPVFLLIKYRGASR